MMIDPNGKEQDWVESAAGMIYWDEKTTSQATTKEGERYLGKTVVVFSGSEDEKLGAGDNLFGEGANIASAKVYGPGGEKDIQEYGAYTMSSDPKKYGTMADGEYQVIYDEIGKSGVLKSHWAVEGRGRVPARNGINPAHPDRDPGYLEGVFIHRSNKDGWAGGGVSQGCPLIVPSRYDNKGDLVSPGWDQFNEQLDGLQEYLMILKRD